MITNTFQGKTAVELQRISSNIIAVEPNIADVAKGMMRAINLVDAGLQPRGDINVPMSWSESLSGAVHEIANTLARLSEPR